MHVRRRQMRWLLRDLCDAKAIDTLEHIHRSAHDLEALAICALYVNRQRDHEVALLLDRRAKILAASEQWCALHDTTCGDAVGRCMWDFDHCDRLERRKRLVESAVALGETICTREPEARGRGEFQFVIHPLHSQHGGVQACLILGKRIPFRMRVFYELDADGEWQVIR